MSDVKNTPLARWLRAWPASRPLDVEEVHSDEDARFDMYRALLFASAEWVQEKTPHETARLVRYALRLAQRLGLDR